MNRYQKHPSPSPFRLSKKPHFMSSFSSVSSRTTPLLVEHRCSCASCCSSSSSTSSTTSSSSSSSSSSLSTCSVSPLVLFHDRNMDTLCTIDYDDTICPSTFIRHILENENTSISSSSTSMGSSERKSGIESKSEKKDDKKSAPSSIIGDVLSKQEALPVAIQAQIELFEIEWIRFFHLLSFLCPSLHLCIISNSEEGWIEQSCKLWMPTLWKFIKKVKRVSARSQYSRFIHPSCTLTETLFKCKQLAFSEEWSSFLRTSRVSQFKQWITMGDSVFDITTPKCVFDETRSQSFLPTMYYFKSMKLIEDPSALQLTTEYHIINRVLPSVVLNDGDWSGILTLSSSSSSSSSSVGSFPSSSSSSSPSSSSSSGSSSSLCSYSSSNASLNALSCQPTPNLNPVPNPLSKPIASTMMNDDTMLHLAITETNLADHA